MSAAKSQEEINGLIENMLICIATSYETKNNFDVTDFFSVLRCFVGGKSVNECSYYFFFMLK